MHSDTKDVIQEAICGQMALVITKKEITQLTF